MGAGIGVLSNHRQGAEVHIGRGACHVDDCPFAVGDDDSDVAHRHHRARRRLNENAARWSWRVAHDDAVLQRGLNRDAGKAGWNGLGERRRFRRAAPETTDPDWEVGISTLELDPYTG